MPQAFQIHFEVIEVACEVVAALVDGHKVQVNEREVCRSRAVLDTVQSENLSTLQALAEDVAARSLGGGLTNVGTHAVQTIDLQKLE